MYLFEEFNADLDHDGENDAYIKDLDLNGDGVSQMGLIYTGGLFYDGVGVDLDGDGNFDITYTHDDGLNIDLNDNGINELDMVDTDGDGQNDAFVVDINGDGNPEFAMFDTDGDGHFDEKAFNAANIADTIIDLISGDIELPSFVSVPDENADPFDPDSYEYSDEPADPYDPDSYDVTDDAPSSEPGDYDYRTDNLIHGDFDGDGYTESVVIDIDGDGIADGYAADTNRDGLIDTFYLDRDGDGIPEEVTEETHEEAPEKLYEVPEETAPSQTVLPDGSIIADTDGDGYQETRYYDTDGDGVIDSIESDSNGDGITDKYIYDMDGDGKFDTAFVDTDFDGVTDVMLRDNDNDGLYDTVAYDADGDGNMEAFPYDPSQDISPETPAEEIPETPETPAETPDTPVEPSDSPAETPSEKSVDLDGDGYEETTYIDTNGDGTYDVSLVDFDRDGYSELLAIDSDGDGNFEEMHWDHDKDGYSEVIAVDTDGNGLYDTAYEDLDGDGIYEKKYVDSDEDGHSETLFVDSDGDGIYDAVGFDHDGDYEYELNPIDNSDEDNQINTEPEDNQTNDEPKDTQLKVEPVKTYGGQRYYDYNTREVIGTKDYIDSDGDGEVDTYVRRYDSNGDGYFDTSEQFFDTDGDGKVDAIIKTTYVDVDGDGVYDTYNEYFDTDADGSFDAVKVYDYDFSDDSEKLVHFYDDVDIESGIYTTESEEYAAYKFPTFDPDNVDPDDVVGNPEEAMEHWECQGQTNRCAVYAQKFIIEQYTGREIDIEELVETAKDNYWFTESGGTPINHVGKLLDCYGVPNEASHNNSLDDLRDALDSGKMVIVGVDADEYWGQDTDDVFSPADGPNHAVQVIGIDESDPEHPMVILNDSGSPSGCGELVPADVFMDAWDDSNNYMVTAG